MELVNLAAFRARSERFGETATELTKARARIAELESKLAKLDRMNQFLRAELCLTRRHWQKKWDTAIGDLEGGPISIAKICAHVSQKLGITVIDMRSPRREHKTTMTRHIAIYLAKELTDKSLKTIGSFFGNRDHTTIMSAIERIEALIKHDSAFKEKIDGLAAELREARD